MDIHLKLARPQADFVAWVAEEQGRTPVSIIEEMIRDGMYIGACNALTDLPLIKEYPKVAEVARAVVDFGPTPTPEGE